MQWPDKHRVAVCLTWDVDGEPAQYVRFPDRAKHQLSELHQRMYGPNVAVWKVLRLLDKYGVPGTFYIPSYTARLHEEVTKEIVRRNFPIGLHGYLHESLDTLTSTEEAAVLVKSREMLAELIGYTPTLYRAPSWELNRGTPELLRRYGVRSDSSLMDDEVPYWLQTTGGEILEVPIQWLLDDAEHWNHTRANRDKPIGDPDTVFRLWSSEFDGYYETGGCYVLTLHPFISGRSAYMAVIERLIRYILGFPGVWWTTIEAVTAWSMVQPDLVHRASPPPEPFSF